MEDLSNEEIERYGRHLVLEAFGLPAQQKLKNASILVVGAGGLGCPALLYLAAAGIGSLGIVDHDIISRSNLQRQILYSTDHIGEYKAAIAKKELTKRNPNINITSFITRLTTSNALDIISRYDVVVDGTDNFATRYLLNDACILLDKPLVYGSILKFEGQVAVFNYRNPNTGDFSSNYRDLFPQPPDPTWVPNCEMAGVLGVLPGLIGTMQANEAIKIITTYSPPIEDKLVIIDATTLSQHTFKIKNTNSRKDVTSLVDYDLFCGIIDQKSKSLGNNDNKTGMKEITVQELKKLKDSGADFQLVDVREPHEYEICHLNGELIPLSEIPNHIDKIDKSKQVVVHCRSGKRSGDAIIWLERNHQFENLYNLKGGILAWSKEIDPTVPTY